MLTDTNEQHSNAKHSMAALDILLNRQVVCWASSFDQEVLVLSSLVDRLTSSFQGSVAEDTEPTHDFQSLAGLQAETSGRGAHQKGLSTGKQGNGPSQEAPGIAQKGNSPAQASRDPNQTGLQLAVSAEHAAKRHHDGAEGQCLLRPWLDHEGQLNQPFWSGLTQRVLSVVMCNPGGLQLYPIHSMQLSHLSNHLRWAFVNAGSHAWCDALRVDDHMPAVAGC